eukprot:gnl/TRDRNA2_/TRDRNA2_83812_c0_seq1.p1 gnl/TRDRNA2_/TRDRNA2_83812_c0~~gnl/TRDRNA2_/TRDRNA2_83812_c0_seq1.p1  ORF type:complete len:117 (-),score=22.77 gnl/TRDRNA2_/TRDRNA2_83812_c0_seq1:104-454(-)
MLSPSKRAILCLCLVWAFTVHCARHQDAVDKEQLAVHSRVDFNTFLQAAHKRFGWPIPDGSNNWKNWDKLQKIFQDESNGFFDAQNDKELNRAFDEFETVMKVTQLAKRLKAGEPP